MADATMLIAYLLMDFGFDETATEADRKALKALAREIDNPAFELGEYLRNTVRVNPVIRSMLADALQDGTVFGTRLTLDGGGHNRDHAKAMKAREEWLEIGRWVDAKRHELGTRAAAIEAASKIFNSDIEKCRKACSYTKRFEGFWEAGKDEEPFSQYGIALAEYQFNSEDINSQRKRKGRKPRSQGIASK